MKNTESFLKEAAKKGLEKQIDGYQAEMLEELKALVAIPSLPTDMSPEGMPVGSEITRALEYALALSKKLGFRTHNEQNKYGWAEVGDTGPLVCIFTHLDIVPVGEGWTYEPFQLTIEGDMVYGRGALDNKGPAISSLYALKSCCDMGVDWPCRVRVWFGTNEENGMNDVQMYIHKYGAPDISFVPDSQFPLSYSELGTASYYIRKQYRPEEANRNQPLKLVSFTSTDHANGVPPYACATLAAESEALAAQICENAAAFAAENEMDLRAKQDGASVEIMSSGHVADHWNEPWTAVNALAQLILFLDTVSVGAEPDQIIHFMASKIGTETDGASLDIKQTTETASLSLAVSGVTLDDFGLMFEIFMISPAEVRVEVVLDAILRQLRHGKMDLILRSLGPGFLRDPEMPLLKVLYQSYCSVTGNSDPIKVCGGTYSKFVPNAIPFGAIFGPEQDICHTPNEHIRISELMTWTKIYADALMRICDNIDIL